MPIDRLWLNATLVTMDGPAEAPLGVIADGALAASGDRIAWVGPRAEAPAALEMIDCGGALLLPGLIDCHTQLVFAPVADQAPLPAGLAAVVRATRAAEEAVLVAGAGPRLAALLAEGVTTVDVTSGFGLDLATEARLLRAARALAALHGVRIETTLLALHAVPPEHAGRSAAFAGHVAHDMLPAIAAEGLADAVGAVSDSDSGFTARDCAMVFDIAQSLGLPVRLHADRWRDEGGALFAGRHGAISAAHLDHASPDGLRALQRAGGTGVLLPAAWPAQEARRRPDIAAMRAAGLPLALASGCGPGYAPMPSLLRMLERGCTELGLTPTEALLAVTRHAAAALGRRDRGRLARGLLCDLALFAIEAPAALCYGPSDCCTGRVVGGR